MAYIEMENGLKAANGKRRKKRRKNPTATQIRPQTKAISPIKRRATTKTQALSFLKANGLKAVSTKSVANGKRKRRRHRNGALSAIPRKSNGILGNSKKDVKEVISLLVGLFGTKGLGRFAVPYLQPYFAQMGAGAYCEIVIDALIGLGLAPMLAQKVVGNQLAAMVRLGGAAAIGIDAIELIAPDTFNALNPFNNSPVVLTAQGAAITPAAVAQIAKEVENGQTSAAKVAGAMSALNSGVPLMNNVQDMMPLGGNTIGVF